MDNVRTTLPAKREIYLQAADSNQTAMVKLNRTGVQQATPSTLGTSRAAGNAGGINNFIVTVTSSAAAGWFLIGDPTGVMASSNNLNYTIPVGGSIDVVDWSYNPWKAMLGNNSFEVSQIQYVCSSNDLQFSSGFKTVAYDFGTLQQNSLAAAIQLARNNMQYNELMLTINLQKPIFLNQFNGLYVYLIANQTITLGMAVTNAVVQR